MTGALLAEAVATASIGPLPDGFAGSGTTVHLFEVVRLYPLRARLADVVLPAERARAAHLADARRAESFLAGRALVRLMAGLPDGRIETGAYGKPRFSAAGAPSFSIAHAGEVLAVAICRFADIGIDVEPVGPGPQCGGDRPVLGEDGHPASAAGSGPASQRSLTMVWTAREAVAKALGATRFDDLEQIEADERLAGCDVGGRSAVIEGCHVKVACIRHEVGELCVASATAGAAEGADVVGFPSIRTYNLGAAP